MTEVWTDDGGRAELSAIARMLDDLDQRDRDGKVPIEEWQDISRQRRQLIARRAKGANGSTILVVSANEHGDFQSPAPTSYPIDLEPSSNAGTEWRPYRPVRALVLSRSIGTDLGASIAILMLLPSRLTQ